MSIYNPTRFEIIGSERKASIACFTGATIADILRVRDERTGTWITEGPVIMRLELCDIGLYPLGANDPRPAIGSIDTEEPYIPLAESATLYAAFGAAKGFRWESYRPLAHLIGKQLDSLTLSTQLGVRMIRLEARIAGGTLRIVGRERSVSAEYSVEKQVFKPNDYREQSPSNVRRIRTSEQSLSV